MRNRTVITISVIGSNNNLSVIEQAIRVAKAAEQILMLRIPNMIQYGKADTKGMKTHIEISIHPESFVLDIEKLIKLEQKVLSLEDKKS